MSYIMIIIIIIHQELVTVGMLRSPELPPPPAWNDDDKSNTSDATFQSCFVSDHMNYPARALGLLVADGAPTVGRGKTF